MALAGYCLVFLTLAFGHVSCLKCLSCEWDVRNHTVDHDCLGAPYKSPTVTCSAGSDGEAYVCQISAAYDDKGDIKSVKTLERNCAVKHSRCNNACALRTPTCSMCCDDNDNCNGFPVRGNIVVSSATTTDAMHLQSIVISGMVLVLQSFL